jgi:hypothetical protein
MARIEYHCEGFRPLTSDTVRGAGFAAEIFANRIARQRLGRRGKCLEIKPFATFKHCATFKASIGEKLPTDTVTVLVVIEKTP